MADEPEGRPTRLRITGCSSLYVGKNSRGDEFTIYEVTAQKADGTAVDEKLRSFENLPLEVLDLMVRPFKSEKYGQSFTLSRRNKPNTAKRIEELEAVIEQLATRVRALEQAPDTPPPESHYGDIPV